MLFDRFGPAQAGNGQAIPNQQATAGAPGLQLGSWGNQPNFAGGMQQFLRGAPNAGQPMAGGPQTGFMPPPGAPGTTGQPPQPMGAFIGQPQSGAPGTATGGLPMAGGPNGTASGVMPQANIMGVARPPDAAAPWGNASMASGMQQYLGRPS